MNPLRVVPYSLSSSKQNGGTKSKKTIHNPAFSVDNRSQLWLAGVRGTGVATGLHALDPAP